VKRGTRVGQAYVAVTADGDGINEEIVDSVDAAGPGVDKAAKKHGKRYSDRFAQTLEALPQKVSKRLGETLGLEGERSGEESGRRFGKSFVRSFGRNLARDIGAELEVVIARQLDLFEQARAEVSRNPGGGRRTTIIGGVGDGDLGSRVGRFFGAGSRADGLHFFGKALGGMVNLIAKAEQGAVSLFKTFNEGFSNASENANVFTKILAGGGAVGARIGAALAGIAASGPAAVAGIVAVSLALSALVSVVGALIGLVTALSATIVSGLVGALTVAGGVLLAVTAAAGLLTAAFMSMTDAQQEALKSAFKPLHEEMIGIGQLMITQMIPAFDTWSKNLQEALLLAAPVAQVMGKAFADAGTKLTAAFSGPGFQQFAHALGTELPTIVDNLAVSLGRFLNGLLGMFSAVMPYVTQFSAYLRQVTLDFQKWATSAEGQNAISDFVGKAVESLKSLWNFVREVGGFIGDLLFSDEAMAAGITIFDAMTRKFAEWREVVREAAANGDLQRWFEDAIGFGARLWEMMEALGSVFIELYNSGVLHEVGNLIGVMALVTEALGVVLGPLINLAGALGPVFATAITPLAAVAASLITIGEAVKWAKDQIEAAIPGSDGRFGAPDNPSADWGNAADAWKSIGRMFSGGGGLDTSKMFGKIKLPKFNTGKFDLGSLIGSGKDALGKTTKDGAKYKNPYEDFAKQLMEDNDTTAAKVRKAMLDLMKKISDAINDAVTSTDVTASRKSILDLATSLKADAAQAVISARDAVSSAASSLASAGSKEAAERAMEKVEEAQADLDKALKNQQRLNKLAQTVMRQRFSSEHHVQRLLKGLTSQNATLADYIIARTRLAKRLEKANEKLADAIALRDDYRNSVTDAARAFGALTTATAQSIGGIEQALTATDITTNLEQRLAKIRKFQENLRILMAQGLSASAYKQIVDAGVEGGSQFAQALVDGGLGAVQQTNSLVGQIDAISGQLGLETSNRMYQAGVDAAQGLVDGLTSLSTKLDNAAAKLGRSIANAIKKQLGIKSPSTVMIDAMRSVGDGLVVGLDRQHTKVGTASSRLSDQIAITPRTNTPAPAGTQTADGTVSGNQSDPRFRDLIVNTPTEDPVGVAHEVLNEVVGRIP
jgi:tetratricopeptide (TPR) repeat protein